MGTMHVFRCFLVVFLVVSNSYASELVSSATPSFEGHKSLKCILADLSSSSESKVSIKNSCVVDSSSLAKSLEIDGLLALRAQIIDVQPLLHFDDPEEQYKLGCNFLWHQQDYKLASYWLLQAADQGHTGALCHLGGMLDNGFGIEADPEAGAALYRKAAEVGCPIGKLCLGITLCEGFGVRKDMRQGIKLLEEALSQGMDCAHEYISRYASSSSDLFRSYNPLVAPQAAEENAEISWYSCLGNPAQEPAEVRMETPGRDAFSPSSRSCTPEAAKEVVKPEGCCATM